MLWKVVLANQENTCRQGHTSELSPIFITGIHRKATQKQKERHKETKRLSLEGFLMYASDENGKKTISAMTPSTCVFISLLAFKIVSPPSFLTGAFFFF